MAVHTRVKEILQISKRIFNNYPTGNKKEFLRERDFDNYYRLRIGVVFFLLILVFIDISGYSQNLITNFRVVQKNILYFVVVFNIIMFINIPDSRAEITNYHRFLIVTFVLIILLLGVYIIGYYQDYNQSISTFILIIFILAATFYFRWQMLLLMYGISLLYLFYCTPFLQNYNYYFWHRDILMVIKSMFIALVISRMLYNLRLQNFNVKKELLNTNDLYLKEIEERKKVEENLQNHKQDLQDEIERRINEINCERSDTRRLIDNLKKISFHDSLTGLYNRSYLEEELNRFNDSRELPLSLIMGDLNRLKYVNDNFGHEEGDKLLQKAADVLKNSCRTEDIIGRWGGDEFLIILPGISEEEAQTIVERIKQKCRMEKGCKINPSIALGIATKRSKEQDLNHLLREADDAMYEDKGHNSRSRN